jgi:hypothetical protein
MLNRHSILLAGSLLAVLVSDAQPSDGVSCGCTNCSSVKNTCGCHPNGLGTNQLVQLSGEILQVEATTNRSSIYVLCNGRVCQAVLHAPLPDTLTARLRQETPAQLTGMFIKTPDERNQPSEWKLLLRSIDDIQLGKRPMFTRAQRASLFTFSAILGSLCFITALVFLARWWRQRKKAYAMELILAERKRIAADFHDTIEQGLATASLILKATLERENHTDSRGIQLALQALSTTQNAARAAVWNLQPDALRDRSLSEALQEIVDAIGVSGKIHVACDLSALPAQLPERLATGLYAIVREACANGQQDPQCLSQRQPVSGFQIQHRRGDIVRGRLRADLDRHGHIAHAHDHGRDVARASQRDPEVDTAGQVGRGDPACPRQRRGDRSQQRG